MSSTATTRLMTTWGTKVLLASQVDSTPTGQMSEMAPQPAAERLPIGTLATKATAAISSTATGRNPRSDESPLFFCFFLLAAF